MELNPVAMRDGARAFALAAVVLLVGIVLGIALWLRRPVVPHIAAAAGTVGDDGSILLTRCGPADDQSSNAFDEQRPPVPHLWVTYNKAKVKALFLPGGDVRDGDPPPYHWKLMGFADATDEHNVLPKAEALHRLPCAKVLVQE